MAFGDDIMDEIEDGNDVFIAITITIVVDCWVEKKNSSLGDKKYFFSGDSYQ